MKATRVSVPAGDGPLTRKIKRISRERGLTVESKERWTGYGFRTYTYLVDPEVHRLALDQIESARERKRQEIERVRAQERQRQEIERARLDEEWREETARLYPRLRVPIPLRARLYPNPEEAPIDQMCRSDWRRIGCTVRDPARVTSYLIRHQGSVVTPLYSPVAVTERPSPRRNWDPDQLWAEYQARGLTLPHAMWAMNRLVKYGFGGKYSVYRIKDEFIRRHQHCLAEGRIARRESGECWDCAGEGCYRCDGSGVYSSRNLYEHVFDFEGRTYSFHSYVRPARVSDTPGADLRQYGRRLTVRDVIPYRSHEYITMLSPLVKLWQATLTLI